MDEKTMEKMAREYRSALSAPSDDAIDRIVNLEEEQIDILEQMLFRQNPLKNRTAAYVKTLNYRILSLLSTLRQETYLPSVRTRAPVQNLSARLCSLQIDLFVLYDRAGMDNVLSEILSLENRKAALIGGLM